MRRSRRYTVTALAGLVLTAAAGCGSSSGGDSAGGTAAAGSAPITGLTIMAPAAPGGGWDLTSRTAQKAMQDAGIARNVQVQNVPGAGGTIGLAQLAAAKGQAKQLMTTGLVMVGATISNKSSSTLLDVTPIARLTAEYEVVVVPKNSPYQKLSDLISAWKADPGSVSIAGGSAGGTEQILAGLMAQDVGIDPTKVNYVAFSGGGEALAAILGGKVSAGMSSLSEFLPQIQAGELRPLAVSSATKISGVDAPSLKEAGVNVELANWRGFVAPPGLSKAQQQSLVDAVTAMRDSQQWKDAVAKNGWSDTFLAGADFGDYLKSQQQQVTGILQTLGLA